MAQDNSEPPGVHGPPPGTTAPPDHVKKPQTYEIFPGSQSAEGTTDGQKRPPQPTVTEAFQSIKPDDFFSVHKIPCARQGLMTGIGAGAAVGMGRFVIGGQIPRATNWAFGAFFIGSILQWEYCRMRRANERAAVVRITEVMNEKQAEKQAKATEVASLRQEAEEKSRQESAAKKNWYRFW
ncbi:hypothetical protein GGR54DRAFT_221041 [Hypoxylon sp. NC1633]|nr:hypothetical protein GGR54DRAFT_221041 [Hypoxylon sp. NC1633]